MWVHSLGQEDPLEEDMETHSIILAWRILWTEEPDGLQSIVSQSRTWLKELSKKPVPVSRDLLSTSTPNSLSPRSSPISFSVYTSVTYLDIHVNERVYVVFHGGFFHLTSRFMYVVSALHNIHYTDSPHFIYYSFINIVY